ncbi:ferrochelatase [Spongiibacter sp. KMU-158]|uniref:Ferrochelatase n=1 Tax=Spongiibacter pelagi TaxID=2760804 RepID=A0A927GWN3_9GAMM|nr:ferrochelatase [Spongiibacter pelagi]MBD2858589.1 ferrochelatase [Spongiibacter pelagi]
MKSAIILINLGTPDKPERKYVRTFLKEFLSDRRVVEVPRLLWMLILYLIILPFRSGKAAKAYKQIWFGDISPLKFFSQELAQGVEQKIREQYPQRDITVRLAMTYCNPSIPSVLDELRESGVENFLFLPLYPQYSATTTAACMDIVADYFKKCRDIPQWSWIRNYHDHPAYIQTLAQSVADYWQQNERGEKLLMSFHGIPKRNVDLGDPYQQHCEQTAQNLADALQLNAEQWQVTYQSRLGKAEWLQPYTDKTLEALPARGVKNLDVICPAFAVECLETLEEIDGEGQEIFRHSGGERFQYLPCLNDSELHQDLMLELCKPFLDSLKA